MDQLFQASTISSQNNPQRAWWDWNTGQKGMSCLRCHILVYIGDNMDQLCQASTFSYQNNPKGDIMGQGTQDKRGMSSWSWHSPPPQKKEIGPGTLRWFEQIWSISMTSEHNPKHNLYSSSLICIFFQKKSSKLDLHHNINFWFTWNHNDIVCICLVIPKHICTDILKNNLTRYTDLE